MAIAQPDFIAGMAKGMAVLESFDTQRQRLNATLAAQRAGITRAAARRHLLTLAHLGYLEGDGNYFWLAPKVLRFSGSYLASARVPRAVQPVLDGLASRVPESFTTVVLDDDEVVVVARSGAEWKTAHGGMVRLAPYGVHLGQRLPAHATSTGRMLLASLRKSEFNAWLRDRELARLTPRTMTDLRRFRALIDHVRADDYCIAGDEHELGILALAVPLRDMRGKTVAALNLVTTPQRVDAATMRREMLPLLLEAARELRAVL